MDCGASCALAPDAAVATSSAAVHANPSVVRILPSLKSAAMRSEALVFGRSVLVGIHTVKPLGRRLQSGMAAARCATHGVGWQEFGDQGLDWRFIRKLAGQFSPCLAGTAGTMREGRAGLGVFATTGTVGRAPPAAGQVNARLERGWSAPVARRLSR